MSPDMEAVAADLAKTSANLARHIQDEGRRFGAELGRGYAKAADERIEANAAELRRATDLVAELKRQIVPLDRHTVSWCAVEKQIRELARTANERGGGVPAGVLLDALAEAQAAGRAVPSRWRTDSGATA